MDYFSSINGEEASLQNSRLSSLLHNDYILADERGLSEMLLALGAYAKNINYFDLDSKVAGDWTNLLMSNDAILIATGVPFKKEELKSAYLTEQTKGMRRSILLNWEHFVWINDWLTFAKKFTTKQGIGLLTKLRRMVKQNLAAAFHDLEQLAKLCDVSLRKGEWDPVWTLDADQASANNSDAPISRLSIEESLENIFTLILNVRSFLSIESEMSLSISMANQEHDPASGMLLAFLHTYKRSQNKLNDFSERLLEYYYQDIQKNLPQSTGGDHVYLQCLLNAGQDPILVKKGTKFIAGTNDALEDVLYQVSGDGVLCGATVSALKTLFLQRHSLITPENITSSVTRLKSIDVLDVLSKNQAEVSLESEEAISVPLFGNDEGRFSDEQNNEPNVALVVASTLLQLSEGSRNITLDVIFVDQDVEDLDNDYKVKKLFRVYKEESEKGSKAQLSQDGLVGQLVDKLDAGNSDAANSDAESSDAGSSDAENSEALDDVIAWCDNGGLIEHEELCDDYLSSDRAEGSVVAVTYSNNDNLKVLIDGLSECLAAYFIKTLDLKEDVDRLALAILETLKANSPGVWNSDNRKDTLKVLYAQCLVEVFVQTNDLDSLATVYHKIISRHIFYADFIKVSDSKKISAKVAALKAKQSIDIKALNRMAEEMSLPSSTLFYRYLNNALILKLTTEKGWLSFDRYALSQYSSGGGFKLSLDIGPGLPSIVNYDADLHEGEYESGKPLLMIGINPQSNIFPYSYFDAFNIDRLKLSVKVRNFKSLNIHGDTGPLDSSMAFLPFGPIPEQGDACYIGAHEIARKNITQLRLNISWKNLPDNYGGFAEYYQAYGDDMGNSDYKAKLSFSSGGTWVPEDDSRQQSLNLFDFQSSSNILKDEKQIDVKFSGQYTRLEEDVDAESFSDIAKMENGYLKLQLCTPKKVFGHKSHQILMSDALTHNLKKRKKVDLPEEPYTPEISRITADYSAEELIVLDANKSQTKKYYLSPMGLEPVRESLGENGVSLFPRWMDDGNLFIAFDKSEKVEIINLYVMLNNDSTLKERKPVRWSYYSQTGWKLLEIKQVLSDSTDQLMHSGVISIRLPNDLAINDYAEPLNQYWLKVSASDGLEGFPSIQFLGFDALSLHSVSAEVKLSAENSLTTKDWRAINDVKGIREYVQRQPAFANKNSETKEQATTRFYERLRHKNRAINAWDYERLVLQQFPHLHMVKCFPSTSMRKQGRAPGHILLIVVPSNETNGQEAEQATLESTVELQQIHDFIKPLMSMGSTLEVENAVYEYLQLHCTVSFTQVLNKGETVKRLNAAICNYMSPWSEIGNSLKFDWTIRKKDIESYIQTLPYISDVTSLSLIKTVKLVTAADKYVLDDSARSSDESKNKDSSAATQETEDISASFPWSLALPIGDHLIQVEDDDAITFCDPVAAGIQRLKIGSTFIMKNGRIQHDGNNFQLSDHLENNEEQLAKDILQKGDSNAVA